MRTITLVALLILCSPAGAQRDSEKSALDAAVMSALTRGDISHARRLAVTAEHWQWIDGAQREGRSRPQTGMSGPASSQACANAQRSHELEAGRFKKNWAAIEAKREAAMAACGSRWY